MKRMKQMNQVTILLALSFVIAGCATEAPPTKEEIRSGVANAKADGFDWCEELGWYGDEICDDFCAEPDPDCGPVACDIDPRLVFCTPGTLFNVESCACEEPAICTAVACPPGTSKNPFTCQCEVPQPEEPEECDVDPTVVFCTPGTLFDVESCGCEEPAICTAVACPPGTSKNPFTCECEALQPEEPEECDIDPTLVFCTPGTLFNVDSCGCEEPAICTAVACPPGTFKNPFTCVCE